MLARAQLVFPKQAVAIHETSFMSVEVSSTLRLGNTSALGFQLYAKAEFLSVPTS